MQHQVEAGQVRRQDLLRGLLGAEDAAERAQSLCAAPLELVSGDGGGKVGWFWGLRAGGGLTGVQVGRAGPLTLTCGHKQTAG